MFIGKPFTCGLLHEGCHLLLVLLGRHDRSPHVDGCEPNGEKHIRRGLVGELVSLPQPLVVETVRHGERWERGESERDKYIEVQEQVGEVKMDGLSAVELGAALRVREDVVLDDVPRDDGQLAVKQGVESNDRKLPNRICECKGGLRQTEYIPEAELRRRRR